MTIPLPPNEELKVTADALLQEIGYYMLRVDQILGKGSGPSTGGLEEAVANLARLIYPLDDEAA